MKKIKLLSVKFENSLPPKLVPAFRGAIIEKVGREHILFHHHQGDKELLYKYPLIQYKSIQNRAAIICLGDGVGEMYRLFSQDNLQIKLHDKKVMLEIEKLELTTFELNIVSERKLQYQLVNWIALNDVNLKKFNALKSDIEKVSFLENILKANILAFAKGVEWTILQQIEATIIEIKDQRILRYKGNPILAFDVVFETNAHLPYFVGLGKSASHGYGMIKPINTKKYE